MRIAVYYSDKNGWFTNGVTIGVRKHPKKLSTDGTVAFTIGSSIRLNINGGLNEKLNDSNNLINVLLHERLHKLNNDKPGFKSNLENHAEVYLGHIIHSSFTKTTEEYQLAAVSQFANYLLNMQESPVYSDKQIGDLITKFNTSQNRYTLESEQWSGGRVFTIVDKKTKEKHPQTIKEIKDEN